VINIGQDQQELIKRIRQQALNLSNDLNELKITYKVDLYKEIIKYLEYKQIRFNG